MHMQLRAALAAGNAALVLSPVSAPASTVVIGQGFATVCAKQALSGRSDNDTLHQCDLAVETEVLSTSDTAKTLVNRGVVLMRRAGFSDALRDFDRAEALMPKLAEVYVNRGVVLMKQHKFSEAVAQIDRGIALKPDEIEKAYYDRAIAREAAGDVKGAYFDYVKAQELKPDWELPKKELVRFTVQKAG